MKDLKGLCQVAVAQQGSSIAIILAIVAVVAAGVLGFMAGQGNAPLPMGNIKAPSGDISTAGVASSGDAQDNPVVARVDGFEITRQDVLPLLNAVPPQIRQQSPESVYPMALEQAISNTIVDRKAALSSLERDPEVQKQLWNAKQQIVRANFVEREVASRVSDDDLKGAYDKYVENFPEIEEVKAAHILVEDEKTAKSLIKKLNDGADFAELAKENSTDGTADRGGELGYFAKTEVVPEFADAAFSTDVGAYTKTPVKSDFGYHIVRVDEKRMRPPASFDRVKPFLQQEVERTELQAMLNEWKDGADIERFDINGNAFKPASEDTSNGVADASSDADDVEPAAGDNDSNANTDVPSVAE